MSTTRSRVSLDSEGLPGRHSGDEPAPPPAPFAQVIGRTRYVVLVAVVAVILVAVVLFLLGAVIAVKSVWASTLAFIRGDQGATALTVELLEVVSMMLKAVVFFIVGVGLYSLFIAPLNVTAALGVETINDLESKIVSVVVVIMAVTFLEHFVRWEQPSDTLTFGITLALVVGVLVLFQFHSHRVTMEQRKHDGEGRQRAQQRMVHRGQEQEDVPASDGDGPGGRPA